MIKAEEVVRATKEQILGAIENSGTVTDALVAIASETENEAIDSEVLVALVKSVKRGQVGGLLGLSPSLGVLRVTSEVIEAALRNPKAETAQAVFEAVHERGCAKEENEERQVARSPGVRQALIAGTNNVQHLIYQIEDGALEQVQAVRERGALELPAEDHPNYATIKAKRDLARKPEVLKALIESEVATAQEYVFAIQASGTIEQLKQIVGLNSDQSNDQTVLDAMAACGHVASAPEVAAFILDHSGEQQAIISVVNQIKTRVEAQPEAERIAALAEFNEAVNKAIENAETDAQSLAFIATYCNQEQIANIVEYQEQEEQEEQGAERNPEVRLAIVKNIYANAEQIKAQIDAGYVAQIDTAALDNKQTAEAEIITIAGRTEQEADLLKILGNEANRKKVILDAIDANETPAKTATVISLIQDARASSSVLIEEVQAMGYGEGCNNLSNQLNAVQTDFQKLGKMKEIFKERGVEDELNVKALLIQFTQEKAETSSEFRNDMINEAHALKQKIDPQVLNQVNNTGDQEEVLRAHFS